MLEGLEISEVSKNEIDKNNRIDSEYYKKQFILLEKQIQNIPHNTLEEIASFLIGPFGSAFDTENYLESGKYRYVRGQDVKPFVLKDDDKRYIPDTDYKRLEKYALKERDILLSVVGTLGNACIVQKKDMPAIFSCKSTVIRSKNILPAYILTYLNCKYGNELLLRRERGAIQKGLNLEDLKSILIPVVTSNFQKAIEQLFYDAQDKIDLSKQLYSEAEDILLKELGLKDWKPIEQRSTIKTFADYLVSGRLDAEYYQPKYDQIEQKIKTYKGGFCLISDKFSQNRDIGNFDKLEYNYIEIGDINISNGDVTSHLISTEELPANAKVKIHEGDILISKVRPYRGAIAIVNKNLDNLIASNAFTILQEKSNFKKEVLQVLFRTDVYKDWLLKWNVGSSYPVIKDENILNLIIPILDNVIQQKISDKITESFYLNEESKRLLELAKTAVETAIKQGEQNAIKLLNIE